MVLSVATAGYVNMWPVVTNGSNIDYHVHTSGYGALLKNGIAGADAVATVGGVQRRYHRTDGTAKSISYTGSAGSDTAAGYLFLQYTRLASRNSWRARLTILFTKVQAAVSLPMDWNSFAGVLRNTTSTTPVAGYQAPRTFSGKSPGPAR